MNREIAKIGKEIIDSLPEYVTELISNFATVSEKLRIGSDEEAMELFNKSINSLGDLWELVTTLISLGVIENNEQLKNITDKMSNFIEQLVEAKEEEDFVLLADIMEYETENALSGILNVNVTKSIKGENDE